MEKVYLKQRYIKNGNVFHQGTYLKSELPSEILNEEFITTQGKDINSLGSYKDGLKKQEVSISAAKPGAEKTTYGDPEPTKVVNTKGKNKANLKVKVNTATAEELSDLEYVGTGTATKIIEARTEKLFSDLKDLEERVKLPRGSWAEIADNLIFEGSKDAEKTAK